MNLSAVLAHALPPNAFAWWLSEPTVVSHELTALLAAIVTLVGVRLCWRAPRYRMSMEERAKDGVLTEDEARRKIQFMGWFGPALTITGCVLLGAAVLP